MKTRDRRGVKRRLLSIWILCVGFLCLESTHVVEAFHVVTEEYNNGEKTLVYQSVTDYVKSFIRNSNMKEFGRRKTQQKQSNYLHVEFVNGDMLSSAQRESFVEAANIWNKVLSSSSIPNVRFDTATSINEKCGSFLNTDYVFPAGTEVENLLVVVEVVNIDGVLGTLGRAGPCMYVHHKVQQRSKIMPKIGVMQLDLYDINSMTKSGTLTRVIAHELGHVLGIGILWTVGGRDFLRGSDSSDPEYIGTGGLSGYQQLGGRTEGIDVENVGGPGTANSHWRTSVFGNELMTGYLSGQNQPLSIMTVKSLQDLGYSVNEEVAESFTIPDKSVTIINGNGGNTYNGDTFESDNPTVIGGGFFQNLNFFVKILLIIAIGVAVVCVTTCGFYMCRVPKQSSRNYIEKVVRIEQQQQPQKEITVVL